MHMVLCLVRTSSLLSFVSLGYELGASLLDWKTELSSRSSAESGGMGTLQALKGNWEIP